jgi:hypothetical protein
VPANASAGDIASDSEQTSSTSVQVPIGSSQTNSEASTAGLFGCSFSQVGDYVHISTWDSKPGAARVASAHGWWVNGDCKAKTANVTIDLQAKIGGDWRTVATGRKNGVYSGGGSANRAPAQVLCSSSASTEWRSKIDVDLVGQSDAGNKTTTPTRTLTCRPQ